MNPIYRHTILVWSVAIFTTNKLVTAIKKKKKKNPDFQEHSRH